MWTSLGVCMAPIDIESEPLTVINRLDPCSEAREYYPCFTDLDTEAWSRAGEVNLPRSHKTDTSRQSWGLNFGLLSHNSGPIVPGTQPPPAASSSGVSRLRGEVYEMCGVRGRTKEQIDFRGGTGDRRGKGTRD